MGHSVDVNCREEENVKVYKKMSTILLAVYRLVDCMKVWINQTQDSFFHVTQSRKYASYVYNGLTWYNEPWTIYRDVSLLYILQTKSVIDRLHILV